ncbi:MAG TPA: transcriptional regulator [Desulfobulbaceae bacterium]|nr:MAG: transcriptional regulator [Deltaproteobacteria bacterium RIFOXYD12_FULL_53_23]HCC55591.1 transcriptional regulator [Desulfobulbaceae bacterium]
MDKQDFLVARKKLGKTQKRLAEILGSSTKAIQGYEQGWRFVPPHVERQIFFLLSRRRQKGGTIPSPCWEIKKCPPERRKQCPAWEFQAGELCWFINGTICECQAQKNWKEKMAICRECEVLQALL